MTWHLSPFQQRSSSTSPISLYGCIYTVARQELGKHVAAALNIYSTAGIAALHVSCMVRIVSKDSLWAGLCILNFNVRATELTASVV